MVLENSFEADFDDDDLTDVIIEEPATRRRNPTRKAEGSLLTFFLLGGLLLLLHKKSSGKWIWEDFQRNRLAKSRIAQIQAAQAAERAQKDGQGIVHESQYREVVSLINR